MKSSARKTAWASQKRDNTANKRGRLSHATMAPSGRAIRSEKQRAGSKRRRRRGRPHGGFANQSKERRGKSRSEGICSADGWRTATTKTNKSERSSTARPSEATAGGLGHGRYMRNRRGTQNSPVLGSAGWRARMHHAGTGRLIRRPPGAMFRSGLCLWGADDMIGRQAPGGMGRWGGGSAEEAGRGGSPGGGGGRGRGGGGGGGGWELEEGEVEDGVDPALG